MAATLMEIDIGTSFTLGLTLSINRGNIYHRPSKQLHVEC